MNQYLLSKFSLPKRGRKGAYIECLGCKKEFYVFPCRLKKGQVKYCSKECYNKNLFGEKNPFYGGKHSEESIRKMISHPSRPRFTQENNPNIKRFAKGLFIGQSNGWWRRYRLNNNVKCEICKFDDRRILIIHHKDKNRKNNKKENIQILCPNCHALEHYKESTG